MKRQLRALIKDIDGIEVLAPGGVDWAARRQGAVGAGALLTQISGREGSHQKGKNGLVASRVQVDCDAAVYDDADQLAAAIKSSLDGYRGGIFRGIFYENTRDGRETSGDREYRVSLDFMVHHRS